MLDDLRGYLQLATGLTEVTASRAKEAALKLVGQGFTLTTKAPDVVGQVQELADDLMSTSKNNRELLVSMIRTEVDRAVGRMGFVREDELAALRRHVQRLERQLYDLQGQSAAGSASASAGPADDGGQDAAPGERESVAPASVGVDAPDTATPVVRRKKKVVVQSDGAPSGDA